jgi:hypothetical protein
MNVDERTKALERKTEEKEAVLYIDIDKKLCSMRLGNNRCFNFIFFFVFSLS